MVLCDQKQAIEKQQFDILFVDRPWVGVMMFKVDSKGKTFVNKWRCMVSMMIQSIGSLYLLR